MSEFIDSREGGAPNVDFGMPIVDGPRTSFAESSLSSSPPVATAIWGDFVTQVVAVPIQLIPLTACSTSQACQQDPFYLVGRWVRSVPISEEQRTVSIDFYLPYSNESGVYSTIEELEEAIDEGRACR